MKFLPLFVSVLLATLAPLCAAEDYAPRIFKTSEGQSIPYRLLTPKEYDPNQKYPLVLLLHGSGERGDDNQRQLKHGAGAFAKEEARTRFPAFVVVPQCPAEARWVDVDWFSQDPHQPEKISAPLALALGAVEEVQKEFSIDPERIYVTGISMGGFGTWDLITRFPERFAAAVPICGGGDQRKIGSARAVPVWAFHGEADAVIKVERTRDMVSALAAAGAEPLVTYYPATGHDSWTNAYSEPALLPWLFAQRRGQPQVSVATAAGPHAMPPTNAFPGDGPTQPGPWFRSLWKDKRSDWAASLEKDRGAVVFFGDSITQGWESLAADFSNAQVANRGISGDTTRGLRLRLADDVVALKPKAVNLLIGTNDLALGATPEVVVDNIRAIVAELHRADREMPVIVNKIMPRGSEPGKFPELIQQVNASIEKAFADDPKVVLCDTWEIFADEQGAAKKEEFPDLLHPNAAGYAKWEAALQPILEQLKVTKAN